MMTYHSRSAVSLGPLLGSHDIELHRMQNSHRRGCARPSFGSVRGCPAEHRLWQTGYQKLPQLHHPLRVDVSGRLSRALLFLESPLWFTHLICAKTMVSGDSRGLQFGPHNAPYQQLRHHLQLAGLSRLTLHSPLPSRDTRNLESFDDFQPPNSWFRVCDVTACMELPMTSNSPTGYAIDIAGSISDSSSYLSLPRPVEVEYFNLMKMTLRDM